MNILLCNITFWIMPVITEYSESHENITYDYFHLNKSLDWNYFESAPGNNATLNNTYDMDGDFTKNSNQCCGSNSTLDKTSTINSSIGSVSYEDITMLENTTLMQFTAVNVSGLSQVPTAVVTNDSFIGKIYYGCSEATLIRTHLGYNKKIRITMASR